MLTRLWPSISLTILGWMPFSRSRVAALGRRSWKRISGRLVKAEQLHCEQVLFSCSPSRWPQVFESRSFGQALGGQAEHWLGFWHESRHFIDCVKEGRQPSSNFADAVKTWELIDRIYEAARA